MARNSPRKSQAKLFKQWKKYLNDNKLSQDEIVRRAKSLTKKGMKPKE